MAILDLANPTRFMSLTDRLLPWFWGATLLALGTGLYLGLFVAPADNLQGETYRIIFIHVPAAWLAMFGYGMMAVSALGTLIWRHPLADVAAKATAPVGAAFTLMALITGSLWGKPMWGTWWEWDARMTSVLILFLMYLGLIALWNAVEDPIKGGRVAAVLILVGSVNLPIIKFSVDWWNTLHQPASVFRMSGSTIDPSMLYPLLISAVGATLLFLSLSLMAMRNEILRRRIRALRLVAAASPVGAAA